MSRMFCTLQEAAKTLNADEGQIQTLLAKGILREFRDGPHRLLKESDVGALARKCRQHATGAQPETAHPTARLRHGATAVAPAPARCGTKNRRRRTQDRRRRTAPPAEIRPMSSVLHDPDPILPSRPSGPMSVRQWFWMGLVQDRPIAIALLAGLVLLLLSGLVAALCGVAEMR